ncbi:MAG: tetratricopeptide repeat protein [Oceanococcaceae bacterium]
MRIRELVMAGLARSLMVALLAGTALLVAPAAHAQSGALDARTFDQLTKAQRLATEGRHDDAIYVLDRLQGRGELNSYGRSQLHNFYAFIYASRDRFEDAIDSYHKVLAEEDAPEGLILTAKYTIGQLYFQLQEYDKCIAFIEEWLAASDKPTPTAHIMLAQAYYQKKEMETALTNVDQAIALQREAGKSIAEGWLRLKAVLHYSQKDYAATAAVYEELVQSYPKPEFLKQLAGMYSELGRDDERLAVFDALYEHGALDTGTEVLNLAYMWMGSQVPYKAGRIIEDGIANGTIEESRKTVETLANAWAQANEYRRAVPTLTRVAELTGEGIFHARLAGVHFNAGEYALAAESAARADELGGLKSTGGNLMLQGMAYYNIRDYESALQSFRQAKDDRDTFDAARKWESYTLDEINRIRAIAKAREDLEQRTRDALEAQENNVRAIGLNPS